MKSQDLKKKITQSEKTRNTGKIKKRKKESVMGVVGLTACEGWRERTMDGTLQSRKWVELEMKWTSVQGFFILNWFSQFHTFTFGLRLSQMFSLFSFTLLSLLSFFIEDPSRSRLDKILFLPLKFTKYSFFVLKLLKGSFFVLKL